MTERAPCLARVTLPETGASRNSAPCLAASAASCLAACGPIVLMSTTMVPGRQAESTPSPPHRTARAAPASDSMVITTSQPAASADGEPASLVPVAARGAARLPVRFQAVSGNSLAARRWAIGRPIWPRPMKPALTGPSIAHADGAGYAGRRPGPVYGVQYFGRHPGLAAAGRRVQVRLAVPDGLQRPAGGPVLAARHQQFLRGKLCDHLTAVRGDDEFLLDPRGRPAIAGGPVGLQGENHALLQRLGMIQRHQPAEDRLLPDGQADPVAVLQAEGGGLVGETELVRPGPERDDVRRGRSRFHQRDRLVHVLTAAHVGVALRPRRAAHRERPVVAGPVAQIAVQDVEERRIAGPDQPV